ncbi:hypothetical protein [Streptomyces johnsoniae]|uniref:Uncharacterized protein n=1 Tax=Streptomyces johnsoniae TaxID=3075532 RepID=A0ABU2S797_9ACTN|nr:hypothetical protein [Streptomyces sp. DSM 41886]MDT0443520.1 hypothetical protein [Streptomyces sp. DSM 41886]
MVERCEPPLCLLADPEVQDACELEDWPLMLPLLTLDEHGKPCFCLCAGHTGLYALAFGTPVAGSDGSYRPIESCAEGESVLGADQDLRWSQARVGYSRGSSDAAQERPAVVIRYGERSITAVAEFLFLTSRDGGSRRLTWATELTPEDQLVSPDGEAVAIGGLHSGTYRGRVHRIAATAESPGATGTGPGTRTLLDVNGVVGASFRPHAAMRRFAPARRPDALIVGSPEYVERYGPACLRAPDLPAPAADGTRVRVAPFTVPDIPAGNDGVFIPAEAATTRVPDDSCA